MLLAGCLNSPCRRAWVKRTVAKETLRIKGATDLLQNDIEGVDDT